MNEPWIERSNDRYSKDEFAYGEQPNNYLKEQLKKLDVEQYFFPHKVKDVTWFLQPSKINPSCTPGNILYEHYRFPTEQAE